MKHLLTLFLLLVLPCSLMSQTEENVFSPCDKPVYFTPIDLSASLTEGIINHYFVPERQMMDDLLQMLVRFSEYMDNDFEPCKEPNSRGEVCGCFRGEKTMANNEAGVRTNADLSMICAFLVKYAEPRHVPLPDGVTYDRIREMAMQSLTFAYSTHKANRLKTCIGNNYWGSVSEADHVWESSLWAMSVAYSAWFQWESLSEQQRECIYRLLVAECNYELERPFIPTGFKGDTKAEENGWEADVLAVTLALFPDDPLAPQWFDRMRLFAINSYSHPSDADNRTLVSPGYDSLTVADLYRGANLYPDYTLQNHNLFHTSYQNVVMQELGEAALALDLFEHDDSAKDAARVSWSSAGRRALMHNQQAVMDSVLCWLALADGELAMPNGNDWSLFLYDQITSYSTLACFEHDPNALMLENMAYKQIQARQLTTPDGAWLLRPDVQARRMGVEAHRVMMTWLMHHAHPTDSCLSPTQWYDFRRQYSEARLLPCQNVVRAYSPVRFSCFSWSEGLRSYTGYFTPDSPDRNKTIVPFRANNTGNLVGWYELLGHKTNARPVVSGIYEFDGDSYVMNGELSTNDGCLDQRFALWSTPNNALIWLDYVTANDSCTILREKGGLLAISNDPLTLEKRNIYVGQGDKMFHALCDGKQFVRFASDWVNIDSNIGVVGLNGKEVAFGDCANNNSILTSKLYPMYSDQPRSLRAGEVVDARHLVYYSHIPAAYTQRAASRLVPLRPLLPEGWNGVIVPDGWNHWFFVSHLAGDVETARISGLQYNGWAPVLNRPVEHAPTLVEHNTSSVELSLPQNHSFTARLRRRVRGDGFHAVEAEDGSLLVWRDAEDSSQTRKSKRQLKIDVGLYPSRITKLFPIDHTGILLRPGQRLRIVQSGIKLKVQDQASIVP